MNEGCGMMLKSIDIFVCFFERLGGTTRARHFAPTVFHISDNKAIHFQQWQSLNPLVDLVDEKSIHLPQETRWR
jgi:hypothetical protein